MSVGSRLHAMAAEATESERRTERVIMCADWLADAVLGLRPGGEVELERLARQYKEARSAVPRRPEV